ncbi:MAG: class I SAM-dependent methyltransferase [Chloroflexi bacterium]|nr:class I SAM-dependent methyltransferase [Chloroflexota bacterium]
MADAKQRFDERYGAGQNAATVALEREVIGGDYGANSYTTREQADELLDRLELTRSDRLLEVGAGRGWPGPYLSKRSGCRVVLTDLPVVALNEAGRRARKARVHKRSECIAVGGSTLPFRPRAFDAIVHSDVLC